MALLTYRFRGAGLPQPTQDLPYSYLPNGFETWMPTKATDYGVEFTFPGALDANHLNGIGALWLLIHMGIGGYGSSGPLDMTGGRIEIDAKLGRDFDAKGNRWAPWFCKNYGPAGTPPMDQSQATNWAMDGDFFAQLCSTQLQTAALDISSDPAHWTYAGMDWMYLGPLLSGKYAQFPVAETIANVSATLHLPVFGPRADRPPYGAIEIDEVRVICASAAAPACGLSAAQSLTGLSRFKALGALARVGDVAAQKEIGSWCWNGVGGGGYYPDLVDMKQAYAYLEPYTSTDPVVAVTVAYILSQGKAVARDFAAARALLCMWPNYPEARLRLGLMRMNGLGGLDVAGGRADIEWAANHCAGGVPQATAMASTGRSYHDGVGCDPNPYWAYVFLARAKKYSVGNIGNGAIATLDANLATATTTAAAAGLNTLSLKSALVDPWAPAPV